MTAVLFILVIVLGFLALAGWAEACSLRKTLDLAEKDYLQLREDWNTSYKTPDYEDVESH